jgi:GT2 family glycosyltransferase
MAADRDRAHLADGVDVSVVIATRDRRTLLARTLRSFTCLMRAPDFEVPDFDVIVADHGSTDGTGELIAEYARLLPLRRVAVPFRGESIAEPKNAGAQSATGDLLVFVDSGMLCPPGFLAEHVAAHRGRPGHVLAGAVLGWDSSDKSALFWETLDLRHLPAEFADPRASRWADCADTAWMLIWGANMSMSRRAFTECGGFDAGLVGWGWDDLELAYRLALSGYPLGYSPGAWAAHYPHPRAPLGARLASARRNWLYAYDKHRAPDLETWDSCDYWDHTACQRRMRATVTALHGRLPAPPSRGGPQDSRGRLLYGFEVPRRPHPADAYVTLPGMTASGDLVSYGLRVPLADQASQIAIVSPAVLAFDWSPSPGWAPIAAGILREMARVAAVVEISRPLPAGAGARVRELVSMAGNTALTTMDGGS